MARVNYKGFDLPDGAAIPDVPADLRKVVDGIEKVWYAARGFLAASIGTANGTPINGPGVMSGQAFNLTVPTGRKLRFSWYGIMCSTVAANEVRAGLYIDAVQQGYQAGYINVANRGVGLSPAITLNSDGLAHQYQGYCHNSNGAGLAFPNGATNVPFTLLLEDIGPVSGATPPAPFSADAELLMASRLVYRNGLLIEGNGPPMTPAPPEGVEVSEITDVETS